ncbi:helix-turn-helix domain-containing protein [Halobaculum magnesiiphilum]|uniref:Helix-turn-helix domain-containing protein n=1 Tax=Halobaculum magnesiiphilum TaxID=1017351 RepID=A0A8T8WCP0_9EURY|nr:helix-turn-helix domain-containing protein [Halobaculum magnesiiphilum]QZP37627.1 helix-turn-helix domain-containing protein [Halobaculum magnesiiphilum]
MTETDDDDGSVLEVEFRFERAAYPFVRASAVADCTLELAELVPRADGRYAEFFNVTGGDPEQIAALAAEHEGTEVSLVESYRDGSLFEFMVSDGCPARRLAELGALPRRVRGSAGRGTIVAEIPSDADAAGIVERFLEETPEATLASKRSKPSMTPLLSEATLHRRLETRLTERQLEVLRTAFDAGYYDWPRESSGKEIAAELGISSATFSEHIHAAERALITTLFEER